MSAWDNIKPFVSKFAPIVGAALGGPLGGAAGALLASALGVKDADPKSIEQAIKNGTLTGDQIVALKQAEDQFALQMKQLDINSVEEMEKLAVGDRESARQREMAVKDWTPRMLAYGVTLGFFGLLGLTAFHKMPPENAQVVNIMIGSLGAAWLAVMNYYFGSSSGSARKTDLLYKSSPQS